MSAECANPLLLGWIKEWLDQAKERNTKGAIVYKKAYESMKACPMTLSHPFEAKALAGIGEKLSDRLTERLQAHCAENGLPMPKLRPRKRLSGENVQDAEAEAEVEEAPTKKPRKAKAYVPTLRSGPYALILALSTLREDSSDGLTKPRLIELAQEHCDSSFSAPIDTTKFHTAWNSHKTLMDKDLVYSFGRPQKKYALTDGGWEVARKIKRTTDGTLDDTNTSHEQGSSKSAQRDSTSRRTVTPAQTVDLEDEDIITQVPFQKTLPKTRRIPAEGLATLTTEQLKAELDRREAASKISQPNPAEPEFVPILSSPRESSRKPRTLDKKNGQSMSAALASGPISNESTLESQQPTFQPVHIAAGAFTVELVLDNREVRSRTDRDYIASELTKRGVSPITRSLELGDALWIAKIKDPTLLSRHGEEGDEIVLDWIVERKRLDDLIYSIKDGRFHEQKWRLRRSGVKNVVYVIESFSMQEETMQKYHEALESSIASTQVIDGYFVKKTLKLDDTIRYLARMTMMLKRLYEFSPLWLIPTTSLSPTAYLPLLTSLRTTNPVISYHVTFSSFSSLASKSDSLTLRDVFLKMLMCTRGLTADKAIEIQKVWSTPRQFVEAFEACGAEGGEKGMNKKMDLVWSVAGTLVAKRKIGKTLSAKIAEVWGEV